MPDELNEKNNKHFAIIIISLIIAIVLIGAGIGGYFYFMQSDNKNNIEKSENIENPAQNANEVQNMQFYDKVHNEYVQDSYLQKYNKNDENNNESKESKDENKEDILKNEKNTQNNNPTKQNALKNIKYQKPKIVLIIDDIANLTTFKKVMTLNLKITPSFFPRQNASPNTPNLAKKTDFYIIHLPLEAQSKNQKGLTYLNKNDNSEKIEKYIQEIKKDFPNVKYINNHTGSLYTASMEDMKKLFSILEKYNIKFLDSRTTPLTQAPKLENGIYLCRNIFLDNESSEKYITNQLKKALSMASKNGIVVILAHPKIQTIKVLKKYEKILKNNYDLIYPNELEKILKENNMKSNKEKLPKFKSMKVVF